MPISKDFLCSILQYVPETGHFYWLVDRGARAKAGSKAGYISSEGYIIIGISGEQHKAHRLAWLYMEGYLPNFPFEIDHKNRKRDDNSWGNLRLCTRAQNKYNGANYTKASTLPRGVRKLPSGAFQASIRYNNEDHYLGLYATAEQASEAYNEVARKLHGEFYKECE